MLTWKRIEVEIWLDSCSSARTEAVGQSFPTITDYRTPFSRLANSPVADSINSDHSLRFEVAKDCEFFEEFLRAFKKTLGDDANEADETKRMKTGENLSVKIKAA